MTDGKNGVAFNFIPKSASPSRPHMSAIPAVVENAIAWWTTDAVDQAILRNAYRDVSDAGKVGGGTLLALAPTELVQALHRREAHSNPDYQSPHPGRAHVRRRIWEEGPTIENQPRMPYRRSINTGVRTRSSLRRSIAATKIQRAAKKSMFRRSYRQYGRANMNMLARGAPAHKTETVVKRLQNSPVPTEGETGHTLSDIIQNSRLRAAGSRNGTGSFGYAFKLDQLFNYTEYTGAYQWYKILKVRLVFYPAQNNYRADDNTTWTADASGSQFARAPFLVLAPDSSSDAKFTSLNEAQAHAGSVVHCFNDGSDFAITLSPKPTSLHGSSGSEVQTLGVQRPWISTDSPTVEHYGLRCYADQFGDSSYMRVKMEMTVAFKGVKA